MALGPGVEALAVEDQCELVGQRLLDGVDAVQRVEFLHAVLGRVDGLEEAEFGHDGHTPILPRITP